MNENQKIVMEYIKEGNEVHRWIYLEGSVPQVPQHVREAHAKLSEEEREQAYMAVASGGNNLYLHIITDIKDHHDVLERFKEITKGNETIEKYNLDDIEIKKFNLLKDDLNDIKTTVKAGRLFNQLAIIFTPNLEEVDYLDEDTKNKLHANCVKISKHHD